jgi:hypothetical protein
MPARRVRSFLVALLAVLGPGRHAAAGELPGSLLTLDAADATREDRFAAAAPFRFALLEDGQVFVGGTQALLGGRLSKDEVAVFDRRLNEVRKLPGLASVVSFSPGKTGYRLGSRKGGKPLDVLVQGDPKAAHPALAPLAALITDLLAFSHPSLRAYEPASYAVLAREGTLAGGCRPWTVPVSLADVLAGPRAATPLHVTGWPTGATPAQVCVGDKRYLVGFRPLVAGEKP